MIKDISIKSFGPIADVKCEDLGSINLLIGHNGSGKTFFLKGVYAALKTIEQYQRGKGASVVQGDIVRFVVLDFSGQFLGFVGQEE